MTNALSAAWKKITKPKKAAAIPSSSKAPDVDSSDEAEVHGRVNGLYNQCAPVPSFPQPFPHHANADEADKEHFAVGRPNKGSFQLDISPPGPMSKGSDNEEASNYCSDDEDMGIDKECHDKYDADEDECSCNDYSDSDDDGEEDSVPFLAKDNDANATTLSEDIVEGSNGSESSNPVLIVDAASNTSTSKEAPLATDTYKSNNKTISNDARMNEMEEMLQALVTQNNNLVARVECLERQLVESIHKPEKQNAGNNHIDKVKDAMKEMLHITIQQNQQLTSRVQSLEENLKETQSALKEAKKDIKHLEPDDHPSFSCHSSNDKKDNSISSMGLDKGKENNNRNDERHSTILHGGRKNIGSHTICAKEKGKRHRKYCDDHNRRDESSADDDFRHHHRHRHHRQHK